MLVFGVPYLFQLLVAKPYAQASGSMEPAIHIGDRILVDRLAYDFSDMKRGDIVVFDHVPGENPGVVMIKRIVGLPGDAVEIRDGKVLVNKLEFVTPGAASPTYAMKPVTVPAGDLFLLGDNRNESYDSHKWGCIPEQYVLGRVDLIYWPVNHGTVTK